MNSSTIAAIATPVGSGGIGIIRISGPDATSIAQKLFLPPQKLNKGPLKPSVKKRPVFINRHLHYGYIMDPVTGRVIDEVLLVKMDAPQTYTREDVVEIQSHCSPVVLNRILEMVLKCGARLAEPGEFTKRAFLNERIDLAQAEAVIDIINARSDSSLEIATRQLKGGLTHDISGIRDEINRMVASVEAHIEFDDDVEEDDIQGRAEMLSSLENIEERMAEIINSYDYGKMVKDGLRLSIAGRPNVGKSSLLNRLLKKERAIVSAIPGTTRDLIEEHFTIQGVPVYITDMAGIHDTEDPVEKMGIKKAKETLSAADIILMVTDATQPDMEDDQKITRLLPGSNTLYVINKCDLIRPQNKKDTENRDEHIYISALTGEGIDALRKKIADMAMVGCQVTPGKEIITSLRQKNRMEDALSLIRRAITGLKDRGSEELICTDLSEAIKSLGRILGETESPDVLDEIFSRFCIGK